MPGVVFLIVVPTANFERQLENGLQYEPPNDLLYSPTIIPSPGTNNVGGHGNNLNINLPDNNAVLRLEVELRDKNVRHRQQQQQLQYQQRQQIGRNGRVGAGGGGGGGGGVYGVVSGFKGKNHQITKGDIKCFIPLEKVLEELLIKLQIDHVTWTLDKKGNFYQVMFPIPAGDPCETTLHCLTELKIGIKLGSSVSVVPCSVSYDAIKDNSNDEEISSDDEQYSKWQEFVESIKSKLTVKQVVDGVRSGGSISFDYLLLIVTADSLAALGLVENNAPNITAAMLVSPLMGPVMSITFGTIISDRELVKSGFKALATGMFISLVFGFIFGLILGTTEMPWGFGDWPTEEMKGRGNARSLWMGVLWALTSGTGVAVALLQGSAGPLIGVAISASLLPPVVNCGLFWALACIWLIYDGTKIPHLKGEPYTGNSSYVPIYTNYIPTEFLINGIVSGLLTVVNVICIFITAIIILKIKEVAAPYTSSPDLRRFWETDIKTVRKTNRSTIRRNQTGDDGTYGGVHMQSYADPKRKNLNAALEQAIREASDDETFRKVKRMSYSGNAAGEITQRLGLTNGGGIGGSSSNSPMGSLRNSKKLDVDLNVLDRLVTTLLNQQQNFQLQSTVPSRSSPTRKNSSKLNRLKSISHSMRIKHSQQKQITPENGGENGGNGQFNNIHNNVTMPTIPESMNNSNGRGNRTNSWTTHEHHTNNIVPSTVRQIINTIANAPQRFSGANVDEENRNLTQNILD